MRTALSIGMVSMLAVAAPVASQPMPMPAGPPIAALCPAPAPAGAARALGRILGAPIPSVPAPMGPATPAFGGTTSATLTDGPSTFANHWASAGKTTFSHILHGPVGPVRLMLETCSTAGGGETVAIYPATADGMRMPRRPRVMFSIAVPRGNVRHATLVIPPSRRGAATGSVHIAVVIENASGRFHHGAYRLTAAR